MPPLTPGTTKTDMSTPGALATIRARVSAARDALFGRAFSPGLPIAPSTTPDSIEQNDGPRQYQFPVGVNTVTTPRRDLPGLTPFEQLRALATNYDVAMICIATRIEELQGLPWGVVARNKRQQDAFQPGCDEVEAFWKKPDQINDFISWLGMLLYELFVTDALTIYKRPTLGGGLYGLDLVDGATIKPLLDDRGRTIAYQQILYGVPMSSYQRPGAAADLPIYLPHELLYKPRWTRTTTPYGCPPTEWIILRINTALRKQAFDLGRFTDGNIPAAFAAPPKDASINPQQLATFEENFNAVLEGSDKARRKIKFMPWAMEVQKFNDISEGGRYESSLDDWMMKICCAAYGVPPSEIGFTADVNKTTADAQENIGYRRGIGPLTHWLKVVIFDPIIQVDLGHPELEWKWMFGESEDKAVQAQTDTAYITAGVLSPDEVRVMRFGHEVEGPAPGPPQPPQQATPKEMQ